MGDLRFRVLGPVELIADGRPVPLGPGRLLDLLATLIMSANEAVSPGVLTETVWHGRPPRHPQPALQSAVARLRRTIGEGYIETRSSGYLFRADADSVDLLRFRQLLAAADQERQEKAAMDLLAEAIGLWRGAPLANVDSPVLVSHAVPGLTETYLNACERWAGLCLQAGHYETAVSRLATLVGEHPFRERMAGQLMLGLYRSGRQADALAAYASVRRALSEEMGIDPGHDLQQLYLQILRGDPSPSPAPAGDRTRGRAPHRLPADTRVFTGRQAELSRLLALAGETDDGRGPGTVVISAIDGMPGIGKTALAVHAAHLMAGRFSDGQLFVNLHGYTDGYPPRTADQVLEIFLRSLGVPPQQIPGDTEERAALYRERLAGTRTLIVLDNAADEAQVRPLIPGEARCLVLVTSRRKLRALDDAQAMPLDVLPGPEATALFRAIAGPARVAAGDPGLAEIVEWCGRLPLALRIAAALLRSRPAWTPGHLAGKLRTAQTRLGAFRDSDRDLGALFDLSSRGLDAGQGRLYRYLGIIAGPEADAFAAAALLDTDPAAAERLLQDLVDHNLLQEVTPGRYRTHDLIRAHARTLALSRPDRDAAAGRLLTYYQHTAGRADASLARSSQPGPSCVSPVHAPPLPDGAAALAWLRTERANLTACLRSAIEDGQDQPTVALSQGLAGLLRTDGPWPGAIEAQTAAVAAAARLGDRPARARALTELGSLRRLTSDYPAATDSLRAALDLYREAGDAAGQARVLNEQGSVMRMSGDYQGAAASLQAALGLYREADDAAGQALCLTQLGIVQYLAGDYQGGAVSLQAALDLQRETGNQSGQARVLSELAEIKRLTGDYTGAARDAEAALAICRELGDRLSQANALTVLGKVQRLTRDYEAAARYQEAALDIYQELGDRLGQANTRTLLAEVRGLTGEYEHAARDLEESIAAYQDLGVRGNQAWALNHYGAVITAAGDPARAITIYQQALRLARDVRQPDDEAIALHGIGENHLRTGDLQDGVTCLHQALEIYQRLGMPAAGQISQRLAEFA